MADEMTAALAGKEEYTEGSGVEERLENPERPGRLLGLDYGSKTVGVAVSDALGLTAQGIETIRRERENKLRRTLARIGELADAYQAQAIVLGYPRNLDGSEGERAQKTQVFREQVAQRTGLPVILQDERLTTNAADRVLEEAGVRKENRKQYLDKMAAALILQSYLDGNRNGQTAGKI